MTEKSIFGISSCRAKEELTQATFDYYVLDTKLIKVQNNATICLKKLKSYSGKNAPSF